VWSLLSLILYPMCVHFTSLMLDAEYWGPNGTCLKHGHNHSLDRAALNYPCPVTRLRVVSHSGTKCRESGTREHNYFCL
jgi:hypothetical protein